MSRTLEISVIICTHNPRTDYLSRVLDALRGQTLSTDRWELVVIDNASKIDVASSFDLTWHPESRHVREEELGLTAARLRGFAEARGELLVFVDDDNLLDPDYLEHALRIGNEYPFLGVWGGSASPEFEVQPESWALPYLPYLAIRECERDTWANLLSWNESIPHGAGMCLRRSVGENYVRRAQADDRHKILGRRGSDLTSHEDHALTRACCEDGLGTGSMKALRLTHLIPANRLTKEYLLRLMERQEYSGALYYYLLGRDVVKELNISWIRKFINWCRSRKMTPFERQMLCARLKGKHDAIQTIKKMAVEPKVVENRSQILAG